MNFASDNTAPMHPRVLEALARANDGTAMPYGNDPLALAVEKKIAALFERDCAVFLVSTGTAANAMALAAICPPWGAVYCHADSHANTDECGAPEFYSAGAKLVGVAGDHARLDPAALDAALAAAGKGVVHHVQPMALTLTNATEAGTVYTPDATAALAAVARKHGLKVHLDGARFANALVSLGCTPAEATWKAGVDVVSFGATKNGCMAAEAIVVFDPEIAASIAFRRKRAGHLFSKMRFIAAQMDAYLEGELWREMAANANAVATRLAKGLAALPGAALAHPVEANEIFVDLPEKAIAATEAAGYRAYRWFGPGTRRLRLVVSWCSSEKDADGFVATAAAALA
jgi:threonine aldolase